MNKTIKKFWNNYCQPAMLRATAELSDSQVLTGMAKTVSENYERRRKLRTSSDAELASKFQRLFDNSLVAMSFYDKDGYLINLNDKMRELCAIDSIGAEYFKSTCLFDTPSFQGDFDPKSKEPFQVCQHMLYPELNIDRYIEVNIQPTFDKRGQFQYYVITSRDITHERDIYIEQQQRAEEQQHIAQTVGDYEQRLNYLLRSAGMYVWWFDLNTRQISFTRSLKKQEFAESIDDFFGSLYEDERQKAIDNLRQLQENPQPFNLKHHFLHTPVRPTPQWLYINGQPVVDDQGQLIALFGILRDVTAMMETHQQLIKEQQRAESSGFMKSTFLANMTHELRTPLNAIVGFSDLLQVVDNPHERQEFIRIIRNNCDILLRLINDIIEISDMGQSFNIEPTDIDFAQVFNDICQTVAQRVQESGVEFLKDNPYDTFNTRLDKGRIQQIITNFVTNAIKYTTEGHIRVGYSYCEAPNTQQPTPNTQQPTPNTQHPTPNTQKGLYIYCEDTGAGIPEDKQEKIFERFVKLNDHVQGSGIGLSICKGIAESCGGTIGVVSEGLGHGSTFWVWIPCEPTGTPTLSDHSPSGTS